ncbi:MAG: flagellar biosynthesis protein [Rhodobacterales bacterium]|nr:flagellar biosynthesis protein [Rhodobacterales bacterium]MDX5500988.1 flagellar biosynthesis protein [Rhodobacterales bacterium]
MALTLEEFGGAPAAPEAPSANSEAGDASEAHLAGFDAGYRAGWDDAVAAQADAESELRAEIGRNLQALAFSYHDARSHVLRALGPLLADVSARLLPEIAQAALPHLVAEALAPYADLVADAPVRLLLHPASRQRVEALIGPSPGFPLMIQEDPALQPGQIWLSLGETETRVDIDAALTTIRTALDDFFTLSAKEYRHG